MQGNCFSNLNERGGIKVNYYLCLDIGGTAIKYGVIDDSGVFMETDIIDTEASKGGNWVRQKVLSLVKKMQQCYEFRGVCISTAGMVNPESGEIFYASDTIPNYAGINLKKDIETYCGIPCEIENDVNCAGLAESISGAAKGAKSVFCLTVGTGIGGCFVLDGVVYRGNTGSACEIGYMMNGSISFQDEGSMKKLVDNIRLKKGNLNLDWTGEKVFEYAREGDPNCIEAIQKMIDVLGRGIANVCYVLNPQVIVLGGGITGQGRWLEEEIREKIKKYLLPIIFDNTQFKFALYKNEAGMIGAWYNFINLQNK